MLKNTLRLTEALTVHSMVVVLTVGKVIQLDGSSQYLDLGTQSETCLGNPLMCDFGMTVQFNLKLITVLENMYIQKYH
jgi:hypothetical protein